MATGIQAAWSTTPATNATADSALGPREGWAPSVVNDTFRSMMAMVKKLVLDWQGGLVTTGTSTAYVLTPEASFDPLTNGMAFTCRMSATNGAAPTFNVGSTGALPIQMVQGTAVPVGFLIVGGIYTFTYYHASAAWVVNGGVVGKYLGEPFYWPGTAAPPLSIFGYGQAISRTTYAAYFAIVGTTYGAGDASTTFNVPDYRGRGIVGKDDMGGSSANRLTGLSGGVDGDVLGAVGGTEGTTLAEANLPAHVHSDGTLAAASGGAHSHFVMNGGGGNQGIQPTNYYAASFDDGGNTSYLNRANGNVPTHCLTSPEAAHIHDVTGNTGSVGSGTAINNLPPVIVHNVCIYVGV